MSNHWATFDELRSSAGLESPLTHRAEILRPAILDACIQKWKSKLERAAKSIVNHARQQADVFNQAGLHGVPRGKNERTAILLGEALRVAPIFLNASRVDIGKFVHFLVDSARDQQSAWQIEIAWGQAKRPCGMLKTSGPAADLGEVLAILRLGLVSRIVEQVFERSCSVRVIGGGSRFFEALFTSRTDDQNYNDQRAKIAKRLGLGQVITFDTGTDYWSEEDLRSAAAAAVASQSANWSSALLSVDWPNLIVEASRDAQFLSARSMPELPSSMKQVAALGSRELGELVRNAVLRIAKDADTNGEGTGAIAYDMAHWMRRTARLCAARYEALSRATTPSRSGGAHTMFMTVVPHNERPRTLVPQVSLLGRGFGDLLPQHVSPALSADGKLDFVPLFRIGSENSAVYLDDADSWEWLRSGGQPLFYASGDPALWMSRVLREDIFDVAGL